MKKMFLILLAMTHVALNAQASSTVFIKVREFDCNFSVDREFLSHAKEELTESLNQKGLVKIDDENAADYKAELRFRYQDSCSNFTRSNPRMYLSTSGGAKFYLDDKNGQTIFKIESQTTTILTTTNRPLKRALRRMLRKIDRELNIQF